MKVYHSIDCLPGFKNAVVATGLFDGVHNGHKALLSAIRKITMETGGESVLMSFDPHPAVVFNPENCNAVKYLSTTDEKINLLSDAGVDHLVIVKFTREFASISAEEYIRDYVCGKVGAKKILSGYNHHFGKAAEGDNTLLKSLALKYNFEVVEILPELIENELVTNSVIVKSFSEGNMMRVNTFLGYNYNLSGEVNVTNNQDNELIECNITAYDCRKILPALGRYVTRVTCAESHLNCLTEITPGESGTNLKIYLHKDDLFPSASKVKLYFYKNLRLLKDDDDGYFFRTRGLDKASLDELLF